MALTERTIAQFRQAILDAFTVYRPNDSVEEGSDAWCIANAVAIQLYRDHQRDLEVGTWLSPLTAVDDKLDAHGQRWLPPTAQRKGATKWIGAVTLHALVGNPAFGPGVVLVAGNGQSYITTGTVAGSYWSLGYVTVAAEAVVAGTAANQGHGTSLTIASPPSGVDPAATLYAVSPVLGTDKESNEDFRTRVLGASSGRPGAGNAAHWIEWAEAVDGVSKAFCYKRMYGLTKPLIVLLGPAGARLSLAAAILTAVTTALEAAKPTGHTINTSPAGVQKPNSTAVQVTAAITPKTGYGPDWTGTLAEDPGQASTTTKVYTTTDPALTPTFLTSGMRVVCYGATGFAYQERIVDVVGPGHYFTVTVPFSSAVQDGSTIYPGGPLWQPCYDAIAAVFDALGPARCTTADSPRVPSTADSWPSKLFVSDIYHAIEGVTGVQGCTVTAPAADQEATCAQYDTHVHQLTLNPGVLLTFV